MEHMPHLKAPCFMCVSLFMTFLRFPNDLFMTSFTTIGMDILNELTTHNGHSVNGETLVDAAVETVRNRLCMYCGDNLCCV